MRILYNSHCCHSMSSIYIIWHTLLGYEPAGLTVHPPPRMIKGGFLFFSHGCLVPPNFFLKKVDFVGDIRIGTHKNVVLCHNHSNTISTKLTSFDNKE